mgnify:CR=1 FL=1
MRKTSGVLTKSTCSRLQMLLEKPSMSLTMAFSQSTSNWEWSNLRIKLPMSAMETRTYRISKPRSARHSSIKMTIRWSRSTASGAIMFQFISLTTTNAWILRTPSRTHSKKKWSSKIATRTGWASSSKWLPTIWNSVLENFLARASSDRKFIHKIHSDLHRYNASSTI